MGARTGFGKEAMEQRIAGIVVNINFVYKNENIYFERIEFIDFLD